MQIAVIFLEKDSVSDADLAKFIDGLASQQVLGLPLIYQSSRPIPHVQVLPTPLPEPTVS